jgi:ArsR family transcriptional regulator
MQPDVETIPSWPSFVLTIPPAAAKNEPFHQPPSTAAPGDLMRDFMAITKALADENRVRMLLALRRRELCVCQIVALMRLSTSTVSKHMSILKQARLVDSRKEGRWMYYHLSGNEASAAARSAAEWVFKAVAKEPRILQDRKRLDEILQVDVQTLCAEKETAQHGCGLQSTRKRQTACGI